MALVGQKCPSKKDKNLKSSFFEKWMFFLAGWRIVLELRRGLRRKTAFH
jgi:hypothetical protein